MTESSLIYLSIALFFLILLSGFFSGSETAMMSINRYRLRHLAGSGHRAATLVLRLLERTDRLLGVILIGNTFANILASAITTLIAARFFGDLGVLMATILLTLVILVFSEISPKTFAVLHSQRVAFIAAYPLRALLWLLYPAVWLANTVANGFLKLFGIHYRKPGIDSLDPEELRSVVMESSGRISAEHQDMLLRVLDSEKIAMCDVMIPRNEIIGLNMNDEWDDILKALSTSTHTRLPLYEDDIDNVKGTVNLRKILPLLAKGVMNKTSLSELADDLYFVPEGTSLTTQMLNFRREQQHFALVVDEYGDIQGLVTVEDIVEEIVGEFTSDVPSISRLVDPQQDGSYIVDASVNVREFNRLVGWELPTDEAKTLSGVIIEHLETIPVTSTCLLLNRHPVEIIDVKDNLVKLAKVFPQIEAKSEPPV